MRRKRPGFHGLWTAESFYWDQGSRAEGQAPLCPLTGLVSLPGAVRHPLCPPGVRPRPHMRGDFLGIRPSAGLV